MAQGYFLFLQEQIKDIIIIILSDCYRLFHIVASRISRSFEFDGQKFFIDRVQSNSVQSSSPESFLILLFWYWRPLLRVLSRDFHFLLFRCFPQFVLRAELRTLFLIPACTQPALCLNREEFHVPVRLPMPINFL
jgi:hypothetical protein